MIDEMDLTQAGTTSGAKLLTPNEIGVHLAQYETPIYCVFRENKDRIQYNEEEPYMDHKSIHRMHKCKTRKRFIKLLMAERIERNRAEKVAAEIRFMGKSYQQAWNEIFWSPREIYFLKKKRFWMHKSVPSAIKSMEQASKGYGVVPFI